MAKFRKDRTCNCPAYKFPHRFGGGACSGAQEICMSCGDECREARVDFGIGPYEYWGDRGVHHDYANVSDCCEAEVYRISEQYRPQFDNKALLAELQAKKEK